MQQPVSIENDHLAMKVYPHLGGKVGSIVDKADRHELLFNFPTEIPTESHYDTPYNDGWYAGWDECFPTIAPCPYPSRPYQDIGVPDHGELWGVPTTTAVPTKDGITVVWHGLRFGYRLTRKLYLDGPRVIAEYVLINLSPFEFRFLWAQHALLSTSSPLELKLPHGTQMRSRSTGQPNRDVEWPGGGGGGGGDHPDFSRYGDLPVKQAWKIFSNDPIADAATIVYPARGRRLSIEYASADVPGYWGLWLNTGGWESQRHVAIEPTTGRCDALADAVRDGSAGRLAPGGRCDWRTTWTCGAIDVPVASSETT